MALENGRQANTRRKYVRLKLVGRVAQVVEQRPFKWLLLTSYLADSIT